MFPEHDKAQKPNPLIDLTNQEALQELEVSLQASSPVPAYFRSPQLLEGAVKIDVEPAGRARMICVVLKLNIDFYQYNETQLLTEAIFD